MRLNHYHLILRSETKGIRVVAIPLVAAKGRAVISMTVLLDKIAGLGRLFFAIGLVAFGIQFISRGKSDVREFVRKGKAAGPRFIGNLAEVT